MMLLLGFVASYLTFHYIELLLLVNLHVHDFRSVPLSPAPHFLPDTPPALFESGFVVQVDLELAMTFLLLHPQCWYYRYVSPKFCCFYLQVLIYTVIGKYDTYNAQVQPVIIMKLNYFSSNCHLAFKSSTKLGLGRWLSR